MLLPLLSWFIALELLGLGISVGYHRLLTHNAFKTHVFTRNALALLAACYGGSPLLWVGVHRVHHAVTDWQADPHTPKRGFWFAHCGWFIDSQNPTRCALFALSGFGLQARFFYWDVLRVLGRRPNPVAKMTRDLQREPFLRALDRPFVISALFATQLAIAWTLGGPLGIVWLWSLQVAVNNATWVVNSFCHMPRFGRTTHPTRDHSRNVAWLNVLTNGESIHNAHHHFPRSAKLGLAGEWDLTYSVIRGLEKLGLAWDVRVAGPEAPSTPRAVSGVAVE